MKKRWVTPEQLLAFVGIINLLIAISGVTLFFLGFSIELPGIVLSFLVAAVCLTMVHLKRKEKKRKNK